MTLEYLNKNINPRKIMIDRENLISVKFLKNL